MIQINQDPAPYDETHFLVLKGLDGLLAGDQLKVNLGETVFVGRSKRCQLSLKKTPRYLKDVNGERAAIQGSLAFKAVSRRHCRVSYVSPDLVEIVNLSRNGTYVDGHRVDKIVLYDCRSQTHAIRLGTSGDTLELCCGSLPVALPRSA